MKHLFTAILLAVSLTASADDFSLYYDTDSNAKCVEISIVSMLQKIVFEPNGEMVAYQKDGTKRNLNLSGVSKIYFSTPKTVKVETTEKDADIYKEVYDLCGRKINADTQKEKLSRGIYIINGKKVQIK